MAPQEIISAGDGYTARYDQITRDIPNYKRCVGILWEWSIEGNFLRTCENLSLIGNNGINLFMLSRD